VLEKPLSQEAFNFIKADALCLSTRIFFSAGSQGAFVWTPKLLIGRGTVGCRSQVSREPFGRIRQQKFERCLISEGRRYLGEKSRTAWMNFGARVHDNSSPRAIVSILRSSAMLMQVLLVLAVALAAMLPARAGLRGARPSW
jgi:hypothetical protein